MKIPDRYTCEDLFRKLDDYLDRALSPEEERLIQKHLETCVVCASEYRFEESLLEETRRKLERISTPADLRKRLAALLAATRTRKEGA